MFKHGLLASAAVVMALGILPLDAKAQTAADQCLPGGGQNAEQAFQKVDQDGNGMISMEEFRNCLNEAGLQDDKLQQAEEQFRTADQNADDRLSNEEFQQIAASGQGQDQQQQAEGQQAQGQQGDQPEATITVDKTEPNVTVQQPAPQITVTVDQPKPEVQVTEGQPEVDVQKKEGADSGQANVEVQTEEPKVVVKTNEGQQAEGQQAEGQTQKDQQQAGQQQMDQQQTDQTQQQTGERVVTPSGETGEAGGGQVAAGALDEDAIRNDPNLLLNRAVMSENGEEIGDIEEIVVDPGSNELYAVIGVGGFLGIGERQVVVPLKNMNVQDDQVFLPGTEDELRQMPEYQDDQWQPLT